MAGEDFTLNDWDRAERGGERARQRCYRRKDKWRTIDASERMGERTTTRREGERERRDRTDMVSEAFCETESRLRWTDNADDWTISTFHCRADASQTCHLF